MCILTSISEIRTTLKMFFFNVNQFEEMHCNGMFKTTSKIWFCANIENG